MIRTAIAILAGCLLGAVVAFYLIDRPANFDECVLAEMNGRTEKMIEFAYRACAERFTPPKRY